ncbi:predicted protein [Phaeodactylum tricornutum CCAP 1055/1]|jgi:hypothetical protein|uniref:(d)CMP kinase n=1 Tax=Phaeodactylum tricornutum (strain CCAP 1055/1) TaxID=556484 RepID=B7FZZ2_PHATC|nr:predicted protein [Phaeodactylum tricornutum CCAP 1055/1]EEC47995.1 predicted protein [Phaeodactylum tricornutum CCAP 1055/1]|eukprot:XP_002180587.1 predicted protein [Phaeodactylum tricornutum CCAP 1055/1]
MDLFLFTVSAAAYRYHIGWNKTKFFRGISYATLSKQNAETSTAILRHFAKSSVFGRLASYEGALTVQRDVEDGEKLEIGIEFAKKKGVIDPDFTPEPYITIDVLGKAPAEVASIILQHVGQQASGVIVLVGLSGTGKGTTVALLRQTLEQDQGKQVVTWSNGNVFRSVTLLAATWCEQQPGIDGFDATKALTKGNIANYMKMLTFGKFNGKYDIRIHGLGLDVLVSEVQNTTLKSLAVSKNIPTVAQFTQGEVILFAAQAVETMGKDGIFVLLEGREQTVDYVRSPHRFNLTLSDPTLIGKRRAAQRLMGSAVGSVPKNAAPVIIQQAMEDALHDMVKEIESQ